MDSGSNGIVELGRFMTGFLVVMGIGTFDTGYTRSESLETRGLVVQGDTADMFPFVALPVVLAHCALIQIPAMVMSIIGGLLIYGTIISFTMFFRETEEF